MIQILAIVCIAIAYYRLAKKHGKTASVFAVIGIVAYIVGIFITGMLLAVAADLFSLDLFTSDEPINEGLIGLPGGLLVGYIVYARMKRAWSKPKKANDSFNDSQII